VAAHRHRLAAHQLTRIHLHLLMLMMTMLLLEMRLCS
jgi:hypothetical protein